MGFRGWLKNSLQDELSYQGTTSVVPISRLFSIRRADFSPPRGTCFQTFSASSLAPEGLRPFLVRSLSICPRVSRLGDGSLRPLRTPVARSRGSPGTGIIRNLAARARACSVPQVRAPFLGANLGVSVRYRSTITL